MCKIGIHQPNFCPWLPYFHKMSKCDIFIVLGHVQFEKNGYQNRYKTNGKWVTKPVRSGFDLIRHKEYCDGIGLLDLNMQWIKVIANTLNIKTKIVVTIVTQKYVSKTEMLISVVKMYGGTTYIANPNAKDKYLDEKLMKSEGIEIEYCKTPKDMQIHTFEAFEKWGIDGTIKQLGR